MPMKTSRTNSMVWHDDRSFLKNLNNMLLWYYECLSGQLDLTNAVTLFAGSAWPCYSKVC